jgi:hypothetical protein
MFHRFWQFRKNLFYSLITKKCILTIMQSKTIIRTTYFQKTNSSISRIICVYLTSIYILNITWKWNVWLKKKQWKITKLTQTSQNLLFRTEWSEIVRENVEVSLYAKMSFSLFIFRDKFYKKNLPLLLFSSGISLYK